jgi:hypothetical protein
VSASYWLSPDHRRPVESPPLNDKLTHSYEKSL